MTLLTDLQNAGLPVVSTNGETQATFSRSLTETEDEIYLNLVFPNRQGNRARQLAAEGNAASVPNWSKWTQAQFVSWCDTNLMTDNQIDALAFSTALKTNLKANNAFTRNVGKIIIALRDQTWPNLPNE